MVKKADNRKKTASHPTFCRAKCALANKKGFSYVLPCVIILIAVMIVFVSLQYTFVYHIAMEQRNETQLKLDGYITRCAVENYNALKQGEAWDEHIDRGDIVDGAYTLLGFPRVITLEYREPVEVPGKYVMSRPTISALAGDSFGVYVQYKITIPFEAFGRKIADITVPIKIVSRYTEK